MMIVVIAWLKRVLRDTWQVIRRATVGFAEDDAALMGAGVAFWAILSLSPLLVLLLVVTGLAYDADTVQSTMVRWINRNVGGRGASWIINVLENASAPGATTIPGLISLSIVFWSASRMFHALQVALNRIWRVRAKPRQSLGRLVLHVARKRALTFLLLVTLALLIFLSLGASTTLQVINQTFADVPGSMVLYRLIEVSVSMVVICTGVGLVYMILPDVRIPWRYVWRGALVTGLLMIGGKYIFGLYISRAGLGTYGAAGSIVALLLWIYLSTQVFFFGAELTQAYARVVGWPREPEPFAERSRRRNRGDQRLSEGESDGVSEPRTS